jgi:hypothetical protein
MSIINFTALKELGKAYGLRDNNDISMFDDLWEVYQVGNKFKHDNEDEMKAAVGQAYDVLTDIVSGRPNTGAHGFRRQATTGADKIVIFSDHHMTHRGHRHDYFFRFNFNLYKEVLKRYADLGYTLVENGDVEELVIFEPTKVETEKRRKLVRRPLLVNDVGTINWDELVGVRIEKRRRQLEQLLNDNKEYYDLVKTRFGRSRYFKISGNHDAYASAELEGMIESAFWDGIIKDILLVKRPNNPSGRTKYAITHGHQFDEVCVPPFAKQAGETISECLSWAFQGPDRIWRVSDTMRWNSGAQKEFSNVLSGSNTVTTNNAAIESVLEAFMTNDVAWEYFENSDPYLAFVREVCTGDEFFKYRHMNETQLFNTLLPFWNTLPEFPTLICGHTHEPRDRARFTNLMARTFQLTNIPVPPSYRPPGTNDVNLATRYMNTGSAGRFENLIWCIEIEGDTAQVNSWSNSGTSNNITLRKVAWRSNDNGRLIGTDTRP